MDEWLGLLEKTIREAQAEGSIDSAEDPAQLAFELEACLILANTLFAMRAGSAPTERARRALERRLAEAAPAPGVSGASAAAGDRYGGAIA